MLISRYVTPRISKLLRTRVLSVEQARAAALFIYFEHHNWLLYTTVGTNFPRGYKVDTSHTGRYHSLAGASQSKPKEYNLLCDALVNDLPFAALGLRYSPRGPDASQRDAHRKGRQLLGEALDRFAALTRLGNSG